MINFNRQFAKLKSKKYVIHLLDRRLSDDFGQTAYDATPGKLVVPKRVKHVAVDRSSCFAPGQWGAKQLSQTIAHELAHACNVPHNGNLHHERNAVYDAHNVEFWDQGQQWVRVQPPVVGLVAYPGGNSSGVQDCIMRYASNFSEAPQQPAGNTGKYLLLRWQGKPGVRFVEGRQVIEKTIPPGDIFCISQTGTGVNARNYPPWSEAGDAKYGKCRLRFCVNDNAD
jgi:hypothetical protein